MHPHLHLPGALGIKEKKFNKILQIFNKFLSQIINFFYKWQEKNFEFMLVEEAEICQFCKIVDLRPFHRVFQVCVRLRVF